MHFRRIEPSYLTRNFLAEAAAKDPAAAAYHEQLIAERSAHRAATAEDREAQACFHDVMDRLADRWKKAQKGERVGRWNQPAVEQNSGYPFGMAAE